MMDVAGERDRPTSDRERMLDVVGLAARLGVTERFVRRLVHERRIPGSTRLSVVDGLGFCGLGR